VISLIQHPTSLHLKARTGLGGSSLRKRISSMQPTLASLNRLIEAIDRAKPEKARLDGERKVLLQNLTSEFQIKTLKEAKGLLSKWKTEKAIKKEKIQSKFRKLKGLYRW
jgi:uncharacterized protein (UPF0335 family)